MYFSSPLFIILVFTVLGQLECQAEEEDVNSKNWPDLSCRDGYTGGEQEKRLSSEFENCRYAATPGPNTPEGEYDSNWGICTKFCMLQVLRILDQEGEYHDGKFFVKANAEEMDKYGYTDDFFDDASIKKIHAQCADLFETVFFVEKERCNSMRANDVYDCVQNALKC